MLFVAVLSPDLSDLVAFPVSFFVNIIKQLPDCLLFFLIFGALVVFSAAMLVSYMIWGKKH